MSELVKADTLGEMRKRYEPTPRKVDDELRRRARGDRGCGFDVLAGIGAMVSVGSGALGDASGLPGWVVWCGIGTLLTGFIGGTVSQSKSGKIRKRAMKSAPLVGVHLLKLADNARSVSQGTVRAVGVFSLTEEYRFDSTFLTKLAVKLTRSREHPQAVDVPGFVHTLLQDDNSVGCYQVPSEIAGDENTWVCDLLVYPKRLPEKLSCERNVGPGKAVNLISAVVDPVHGLVEHL